MAYVYRRSDSPFWWIGYVGADGTEFQEPTKYLIGKTKTEQRDSEFRATSAARAKEQRAWEVRNNLAEPDIEPKAFEDVAERYLRLRAWKKASFKSIASRVRGHIIPHFRGRAAHLVKGADIDEFLSLRAQGAPCRECEPKGCQGKERATCPCARKCHRPAKPETLNKMRNHIRAIFEFGIHADKAVKGENPTLHSEPIDVPEREPVVAPPEALRALLGAEDEELRNLFATCLWLGIRKKEALQLRKDKIHLDKRLMTVPEPKNNKWRPVGIPPPLVPFLESQIARTPPGCECLFADELGQPHRLDWKIEKRMETVLKHAGVLLGYDHRCVTRGQGKGCGHIERHATKERRACPACGRRLEARPVVPHYTLKDLRSTWATLAYEETEDRAYVQRQLGHNDPRTTDRYLKMRDKQLAKQAGKLKLVEAYDSLTEEAPPAPAATEAEG